MKGRKRRKSPLEDGSNEPGGKRREGAQKTWWERSSHMHEEMDGQSIRPKCTQLNMSIMVAATTLLDQRKGQEETAFGTLNEYGSDDVEFLKDYTFPPSVGASSERDLLSIIRMFIGRFVYKQILETPFMGHVPCMELIEDALKQAYNIESKSARHWIKTLN
jgi:hypothetical protein